MSRITMDIYFDVGVTFNPMGARQTENTVGRTLQNRLFRLSDHVNGVENWIDNDDLLKSHSLWP